VTRLVATQQTDIALLFSYITANGTSMAHLRNAARAIFGPPGICKWEGLCIHVCSWVWYLSSNYL